MKIVTIGVVMNGERGSDKPGFWELFGGGRK